LTGKKRDFMRKPLLSIFVLLLVSLMIGCADSASPPPDAPDAGIGKASRDAAIPSWVTWLANHWGADVETWVEMAGSSDGGDIEWWLRSSDLYGDHSAKTWNHVAATYSMEPIAIPTDCDSLDDPEERDQLAEAFASQLMDGLCENNELWSFQITEYIISKLVTEKSIRYAPEEEDIWVCCFWADFKFDGLISPIAWGNTGDFVGDDPCGMYEMVLEGGSCVFYPVYSDNRQRVVQ